MGFGDLKALEREIEKQKEINRQYSDVGMSWGGYSTTTSLPKSTTSTKTTTTSTAAAPTTTPKMSDE